MAGKAILLARKSLFRAIWRRVKKAAPVSSFSLGMSMLAATDEVPPLAISWMGALLREEVCFGGLW